MRTLDRKAVDQLTATTPKGATLQGDDKYRAEFKAGKYSMTEAEYIAMRRIDDGLDELKPYKANAETTSKGKDDLQEDVKYRGLELLTD